MKFDSQVFAGNLRALRARRNISQNEAARLIGINPTTLSSYESSACGPSLENACKIAEFYGVSVSFLVTDIVGCTPNDFWEG